METKRMDQATMLAQIHQVLKRGKSTDVPAYTLILGAGASFGVVPTAKEMLGIAESSGNIHRRAIPLWLYQQQHDAEVIESNRQNYIREFWRSFISQNPDLDSTGRGLDEDEKLRRISLENEAPHQRSIPFAYQALFGQKRVGGLNTPDEARQFLREITISQDGTTKLNATHFFLASLLSLQRRVGSQGVGGKPLYDGKRPFARTLFTTNFDPLLQTSLQLFQLLYYMTDRPDMLTADALQTDNHLALHLFYAHGSVHRPFLANTDEEITHLKQRNARDLASYLGSHGVIVLGYSGWDDCLLNALNQTTSFAHNLYWLARGENSLSSKVRDFLTSHPNAYWVPIEDGGKFMAALHSRLCPGARNTELLYNPIRPLIDQLSKVSLSGITAAPNEGTESSGDESGIGGAMQNGLPKEAEEIQKMVVRILKDAERLFVDPTALVSVLGGLERHADLSFSNQDWGAALAAYNSLLQEVGVSMETRAKATYRRGYCYEQKGEIQKAIANYDEVVNSKGNSVDFVARALFNRGLIYGRQKEIEKEISDCTEIINMTSAPADVKAGALVWRGFRFGEKGETDKQIADYTEIIKLKDAPLARQAWALFYRSDVYRKQNNVKAQLADLDRLYAMKDAPAEYRAKGLLSKGDRHGENKEVEKQVVCYTEVIDMKDAPVEQKSKALESRLTVYIKAKEFVKAVEDCGQLINSKDAPVGSKAAALYSRGLIHIKLGDTPKGTADMQELLAMKDAPKDFINAAKKALDEQSKVQNKEQV